jgi:hypothetical protein
MDWYEVTLKNKERLFGVIVAPDGHPTASHSLSTHNPVAPNAKRQLRHLLARLGRGVGDMGVVPESDEGGGAAA